MQKDAAAKSEVRTQAKNDPHKERKKEKVNFCSLVESKADLKLATAFKWLTCWSHQHPDARKSVKWHEELADFPSKEVSFLFQFSVYFMAAFDAKFIRSCQKNTHVELLDHGTALLRLLGILQSQNLSVIRAAVRCLCINVGLNPARLLL